MQPVFPYTDETLLAIEKSLDLERLSTYSSMAGDNRELAIRLYLWNIRLAEALYAPIQTLEVAVRNALNQRLIEGYGKQWYQNSAMAVDFNLRLILDEAITSRKKQRKAVTTGGIVSELSFGFWTGILGSKYETHLWRPHLRQAFPHTTGSLERKVVHGGLVKIRRLRNRIAHHEPILERNLSADHKLILELLSWINPIMANWVAHHSYFEEVFSEKPT